MKLLSDLNMWLNFTSERNKRNYNTSFCFLDRAFFNYEENNQQNALI
jgi:hypothetical protein